MSGTHAVFVYIQVFLFGILPALTLGRSYMVVISRAASPDIQCVLSHSLWTSCLPSSSTPSAPVHCAIWCYVGADDSLTYLLLDSGQEGVSQGLAGACPRGVCVCGEW